jgi:hypothetical protein
MTAPIPSSAHSQRGDVARSDLRPRMGEPFIVDSTKIAAKLDGHATPLDQALADTLATYQANPS